MDLPKTSQICTPIISIFQLTSLGPRSLTLCLSSDMDVSLSRPLHPVLSQEASLEMGCILKNI